LEVNKKGDYQPTVDNIVLILENDPQLKRRLAFNEFEQKECIVGKLPWAQKEKDTDTFTDADVSNLMHYLEKRYKISSAPKVDHALKIIFTKYSYNPIKEYLNALDWDEEERIETLLIEYLGAEDNAFVRAATRKTLVAAVARIFEPEPNLITC
jgi:putative DNA primase/helicase